MNILVTLDYELFFGANTGTVETAITGPTDALRAIIEPKGGKLVLFVDAGFILALRREMMRHPELSKEYDAVCRHVSTLAKVGHEIQLHIHSHWEDCTWSDGRWVMDTRRYKLHDFEPAEIERIVSEYVTVLRDLAGPGHAYVYRAGGWVIQPFISIREALARNGVYIDSTVYAGGSAEDSVHLYDFHAAPRYCHWRFEEDPTVPAADGRFLEIPIASLEVAPEFYWRFVWMKKFGGSAHKAFGQGSAIPLSRSDLARKLTRRTQSVVSVDGYKASLLEVAYRRYETAEAPSFVLIGHPKAFTPYSLHALTSFLDERRMDKVTTYAPYKNHVALGERLKLSTAAPAPQY